MGDYEAERYYRIDWEKSKFSFFENFIMIQILRRYGKMYMQLMVGQDVVAERLGFWLHSYSLDNLGLLRTVERNNWNLRSSKVYYEKSLFFRKFHGRDTIYFIFQEDLAFSVDN